MLPAMITAILRPLFRQYIRDTESPQETLWHLNGDLWSLEERVVAVVPHDRLLLVTDGVAEARSRSGACFGLSGLEKVLRDTADLGLKEAMQQLWDHLSDYTGNQFGDDMTCVAVDFTGGKT
jgi:serine phosphatase RsbU (regulator of sigma subunit)